MLIDELLRSRLMRVLRRYSSPHFFKEIQSNSDVILRLTIFGILRR